MSTALAAVFEKPYEIQLREFPLPILKPGEILVRNLLCTICGSDLHTYEGRRGVDGPTVLGHEILGVVEAMEGNVTAFDGSPLNIGDRIVWSLCVSCWQCDRCQKGLPQKCRQLKKYGHLAINDDYILTGGLATHTHLLPNTSIFRVPEELSDSLACPSSCATATVHAAHTPRAGQVILVMGAGMLGLTACAYLNHAGAGFVLVADINDHRLKLANQYGADGGIRSDLPFSDVESEVKRITGRNRVDVVLEMSGAPACIDLGYKLLDVGGKLVLVGAVFPVPDFPVLPEDVIRKQLTICGVHNYHPDNLAGALAFLNHGVGTFPFSEMVSREFSLQQVKEALDFAVKEKPFRVAVRP